jgi:hypothetical protein
LKEKSLDYSSRLMDLQHLRSERARKLLDRLENHNANENPSHSKPVRDVVCNKYENELDSFLYSCAGAELKVWNWAR